MIMMEVGQVCLKTKGREAGMKVVVLSNAKGGRVLIDGPKVKRKECNVLHLFPTNDKISIKESASHAEVVKAMAK